jgi:hypothetical protein
MRRMGAVSTEFLRLAGTNARVHERILQSRAC